MSSLRDELTGAGPMVPSGVDGLHGFAGAFEAMQRLKFELLIPINDQQRPTARGSFNDHVEHFAAPWGLADATGACAHTTCGGSGMERLKLARLRHHGLSAQAWPAAVREALDP